MQSCPGVMARLALMSRGLPSEDTVVRGRLFNCITAGGFTLYTLTRQLLTVLVTCDGVLAFLWIAAFFLRCDAVVTVPRGAEARRGNEGSKRWCGSS